jgi:tetratricopeptide (TPR) repeat protein
MGGYVAIAFLISVAAVSAKAETLEYCHKGAMAGEKGDFELAIEHFSRCIEEGELTPVSTVTAYYNRGTAHQRNGQPDEAIQDYDKVIGLDPDHLPAFYNRGTIYESRGDYGRAIADYKEVVRLNPEHPYAHVNRGNSYQRLGQYDQAIHDYDEAIRIYPQLALAYYNRGNAYYRKDQHAQAIQDYDQAIGLDPNYAQAYYSRGLIYYKENKRDQAFRDYSKAISIDPGYNESPYAKVPVDTKPEMEVSSLKSPQTADKTKTDPETTTNAGREFLTLHFSSLRTDDAALAEWTRLQGEFPKLLGQRELLIRSVDIEGQGIFLRVLTGSFPDRGNAKALCKEFESRKQYCAVLPLADAR